MNFSRLLPLVLSGAFAVPLFAQDGEGAVAKAKELVAAGKCAEVPAVLDPVVKKQFKKHAGETAAVILAECDMRIGKKKEAAALASKFIEYHVNSPYRERMEVINAISQIENGYVYEGVEELLAVLAYTENPAARKRARDVAIQTLAASLLPAEELQSLLDKYAVDKDVNGWLELQLGRESQNDRRYKAARYWYNKVLKREGISERLQETAQKGLTSLEDKGAGRPTILMLAPLSGEFAEFGVAAIHGALLAFEEAKLGDKAAIRIADTRADAYTALKQAQKAINQDSIVAIVGPIMSAPSATVAAWLGSNFPKIPMITPTATDDGIAQMGGNIFQLNITMSHLAKTIADYAIDCFNVREFAIMSPLGDYGNAMSQSFTQAVERRGGKVVAFQNYMEGRPDYKSEFDLLRANRYKQLNRKKNIARGADDIDAVNSKDRKDFMKDSTARFPAIFLPATNPSDAGLMIGQIAFNKLSANMYLGTSGWYGRELLANGKQHANGSFFSVPGADVATDSEAYKKFAKAYEEKWAEKPTDDKVAVLTYDATNVVITAMKSASGDVAKEMRQKGTFKGALGEIKFKNGANVSSKIVGIEKNRFKFEDGCPVAESDSTAQAPAKK